MLDNNITEQFVICNNIISDILYDNLGINLYEFEVIEEIYKKVKTKPISALEVEKQPLYQINQVKKIKEKRIYEQRNPKTEKKIEPNLCLKLVVEDYNIHKKQLAYEVSMALEELIQNAITGNTDYRLRDRDEKKQIMNSIIKERMLQEKEYQLQEAKRIQNMKSRKQELIKKLKIANKSKSLNKNKERVAMSNTKAVRPEVNEEYQKYLKSQKEKLENYKKKMQKIKEKNIEDQKKKELKEKEHKKKLFEEFNKKRLEEYKKLFDDANNKNKLKYNSVSTYDELAKLKKINKKNIENNLKIKEVEYKKVENKKKYISEIKGKDYFVKFNNDIEHNLLYIFENCSSHNKNIDYNNKTKYLDFQGLNYFIKKHKLSNYLNSFEEKKIFNSLTQNNNSVLDFKLFIDYLLNIGYLLFESNDNKEIITDDNKSTNKEELDNSDTKLNNNNNKNDTIEKYFDSYKNIINIIINN